MIKLNAGFSRKVGEPNYGSRGASVNVELELESGLITDPDALMARIHKLFEIALRFLDEELNNTSVITKAKKPVVEKHTLTPEPNQVARTKAVVRRVWKAISNGHFYPSPSAMNCSTCPHKTACREWEG